MQFFLALSVFLFCRWATPVAAQSDFSLQITTDRGCIEDGDDPVYGVGELIAVTFEVDSTTRSSAAVQIFDVLADGSVGVISFGLIATNQERTFSARIGPPIGTEQLVLQAQTASGASRTRRACSFRVVNGVPGSTRTPTPTRTPAAGGTATATATPEAGTPTAAPAGTLNAQLSTDRGCIESGDAATYAVGDPIMVRFRIGSATLPSAQVALSDTFPNGEVRIFSFGILPTNATFILNSQVGPPSGLKTLEVRARNGGATASAVCSFRVAGQNTPAPTRTATPLRTRTMTPSSRPCTGACSMPNVVTVNDLVIVTQIAAGDLPLSACPSADANGDGSVSLFEVLRAVNNAIYGCP